MFQLTFAIITPALIIGGFAERTRFAAMLWFSILWLLIVYIPVAHWVWAADGWLFERGFRDFAGGAVVHVNAGVAALVAALVIGNRTGFPTTAMPPHNLTMTVIGASLLWVGWFGFNAGSALAANGAAGMAMLVTHVGAAAGATAWMSLEWLKFGKPSVLGIVTGMVAGLGTITPASGFVGPMGALIIGLVAGVVCFFATQFIKRKLKIDDSLDVFPVHGVGGFTGLLLTAVFSAAAFDGLGLPDGVTIGQQLVTQLIGAVATARLERRRDVRDPEARELGGAAARVGGAGERRPRSRAPRGARLQPLGMGGFAAEGELEGDLEPSLGPIRGGHGAAVQLRDARGDREADALAVLAMIAALIGAVERLENPLQLGFRHAWPAVEHADRRRLAVRIESDFDRFRAIAVDQRVAHDVFDGALQPVGVAA